MGKVVDKAATSLKNVGAHFTFNPTKSSPTFKFSALQNPFYIDKKIVR